MFVVNSVEMPPLISITSRPNSEINESSRHFEDEIYPNLGL